MFTLVRHLRMLCRHHLHRYLIVASGNDLGCNGRLISSAQSNKSACTLQFIAHPVCQ